MPPRAASAPPSSGRRSSRSRPRSRVTRSTAGRSASPGGPCARWTRTESTSSCASSGDLTLHSHLRMGGMWGVYDRGRRWSRSPRRAWLVIRTPEHEVVEFDGPVLELMTESRTRFDLRLAGARTGHPRAGARRGSGSSRACARTTRPAGSATPCSTSATSRGSATSGSPRAASTPRSTRGARSATPPTTRSLAIVRATRARMQDSVSRGGHIRGLQVYDRAGRQCPRCKTRIRARGQGDDNRTTYWCPDVPALKRVGHKGADHVAPGNTSRELRGGARARRGHDRVRRAAPARRAARARARLRATRRSARR